MQERRNEKRGWTKRGSGAMERREYQDEGTRRDDGTKGNGTKKGGGDEPFYAISKTNAGLGPTAASAPQMSLNIYLPKLTASKRARKVGR